MDAKIDALRKLGGGGAADYTNLLDNVNQMTGLAELTKQVCSKESVSAIGFNAQTNQNQADQPAKKKNPVGKGLW